MEFHLMRHSKVEFKWKFFYDSYGFEKACRMYDSSSILQKPLKIKVGSTKIYTSKLSRSIETASLVDAEVKPVSTALLNEVPLKAFVKPRLKYLL